VSTARSGRLSGCARVPSQYQGPKRRLVSALEVSRFCGRNGVIGQDGVYVGEAVEGGNVDKQRPGSVERAST